MIQTAIKLITKALGEVDNAENVLKIKGVIALFIQTMEASILDHPSDLLSDSLQGWGYSVSALDNFLLILFEKYAELLQKRFSEDFHEVRILMSSSLTPNGNTIAQIVSTDDYMPMPIATLEEYEKVVNVTWFTPDKEPT
jgi:exocyst complex component 6